ncbi:transglutaminase family protein [Agrobacterium sp. ES01]|uniref:transglutaminase family protein n=1 Tax=Agrobacterium sp. ES01 TaxID=3420714 RepID=UPI003D0BB5E9
MLYDLSLHMGYLYDTAASGAHHILRLLPMTLPDRQRLVAGTISIEPTPDETSTFTDFFEHPVTSFQLRSHHEKLDIRMKARIIVQAEPVTADLSPVLENLPAELATYWSLEPASPHHFMGTSQRIDEVPEIAAYARDMVTPGQTVRQLARHMCTMINRDFTYDPEATTVDTTPKQAFEIKRGVCQDFTHVMIIALRSLGIPAGYVSGFLRTIPPEGKERLEGADAMHAWVRVWCGAATGWIELDPTNDILAGTDHIVVGYGRDYSDVAPVIGILKTYGSHQTVQAVDVIPVT